MKGKQKHVGRKVGNNKAKCAVYAGRHSYEKNKLRRLTKHLKHVGGADKVARDALERLRLWRLEGR